MQQSHAQPFHAHHQPQQQQPPIYDPNTIPVLCQSLIRPLLNRDLRKRNEFGFYSTINIPIREIDGIDNIVCEIMLSQPVQQSKRFSLEFNINFEEKEDRNLNYGEDFNVFTQSWHYCWTANRCPRALESWLGNKLIEIQMNILPTLRVSPDRKKLTMDYLVEQEIWNAQINFCQGIRLPFSEVTSTVATLDDLSNRIIMQFGPCSVCLDMTSLCNGQCKHLTCVTCRSKLVTAKCPLCREPIV
jgi:hypothetical protein